MQGEGVRTRDAILFRHTTCRYISTFHPGSGSTLLPLTAPLHIMLSCELDRMSLGRDRAGKWLKRVLFHHIPTKARSAFLAEACAPLALLIHKLLTGDAWHLCPGVNT